MHTESNACVFILLTCSVTRNFTDSRITFKCLHIICAKYHELKWIFFKNCTCQSCRACLIQRQLCQDSRCFRSAVDKKQTYMKTETRKVYSTDFWIFLRNVIKIDPYNFELCGFKVGAFFWDTVYRTPWVSQSSQHRLSPVESYGGIEYGQLGSFHSCSVPSYWPTVKFREPTWKEIRSQAVARIADSILPHSSIMCRQSEGLINGKSDSNNGCAGAGLWDDRKRPLNKGQGHAHFPGKLFVRLLVIPHTKPRTKFEVSSSSSFRDIVL